jgi:hypothetical protein
VGFQLFVGGGMKIVKLAAVLLVVGLLQGCYTMHLQTQDLKNIASFSDIKGQNKGTFDKDYRQWYILWGLIQLGGEPDFQKDIKGVLNQNGGNAIANMEVESGMDFPWILLNLLTSYVSVVNNHTHVTGDVIKY